MRRTHKFLCPLFRVFLYNSFGKSCNILFHCIIHLHVVIVIPFLQCTCLGIIISVLDQRQWRTVPTYNTCDTFSCRIHCWYLLVIIGRFACFLFPQSNQTCFTSLRRFCQRHFAGPEAFPNKCWNATWDRILVADCSVSLYQLVGYASNMAASVPWRF